MSEPDTFLPATATSLAKAQDGVEGRLSELPIDAITKDPMLVPEAFLDHLAWEYSVDTWGHDLPVEVRRKIIKNAEEVHRYKGTLHGLKVALESFDWSFFIEEWWQQVPEGQRGTFTVRAYPTEAGLARTQYQILDQEVDAIRNVVLSTKPVSRGVTLLFELVLAARPVARIGAATRAYMISGMIPRARV